MEIPRPFAEFVIAQLDRKCIECKGRLEPLTSLCINILNGNRRCNVENGWPKYDELNYYEHMDLKSCGLHGSGLHWCQHPTMTCKFEELKQTCVGCCKDVLDH